MRNTAAPSSRSSCAPSSDAGTRIVVPRGVSSVGTGPLLRRTADPSITISTTGASSMTSSIAVAAVAAMRSIVKSPVVTRGVEGGRKGNRGALTYIGISILSGLAIILGVVALIVPGLILSARWSPVYGYALGEGQGVTDAMSESWEATRGHTLPILLALLVPIAFTICGLGLMVMSGEDIDRMSWSTAIAINGFVYLGSALGIAVGLSVFSLLARQGSDAAEVFG